MSPHHNTLHAPMDERQAGWGQAAVTHFLCSGRDWEAVRAYLRSVVVGDATIGSLGLQLLAPPPPMPPPPAGACSAACSAAVTAQQADQSSHSTSDDGKPAEGQQTVAQELPQQRAAAQRCRRPAVRSTFRVRLSYYGPAFRWGPLKHAQSMVQLPSAQGGACGPAFGEPADCPPPLPPGRPGRSPPPPPLAAAAGST